MAWKEDENGNMVRVNIGGQSKIKPMGEQVAALHKTPKRKGWPKGKSRKPQVEQLKEIEKRIQLAANLSEEEKSEARQRARDHVLKKRKEKAIDQYFEAAVKAEEQALNPFEALEDFTIDLPEYTYMVRIDGVEFYHGCTYKFAVRQHGRDWELLTDPFARSLENTLHRAPIFGETYYEFKHPRVDELLEST